MRITLLALALTLVGLPHAEARSHVKKRQTVRMTQARARAKAEHEKIRAEQAREEAELAEIRSGHLTEKPVERDFPTQQADDAEVPPGLARR